MKREAERLFSGVDLLPPTAQPTEPERLRSHAARLRELAARGMSPRKFTKEAAAAEQLASELEGIGE